MKKRTPNCTTRAKHTAADPLARHFEKPLRIRLLRINEPTTTDWKVDDVKRHTLCLVDHVDRLTRDVATLVETLDHENGATFLGEISRATAVTLAAKLLQSINALLSEAGESMHAAAIYETLNATSPMRTDARSKGGAS